MAVWPRRISRGPLAGTTYGSRKEYRTGLAKEYGFHSEKRRRNFIERNVPRLGPRREPQQTLERVRERVRESGRGYDAVQGGYEGDGGGDYLPDYETALEDLRTATDLSIDERIAWGQYLAELYDIDVDDLWAEIYGEK